MAWAQAWRSPPLGVVASKAASNPGWASFLRRSILAFASVMATLSCSGPPSTEPADSRRAHQSTFGRLAEAVNGASAPALAVLIRASRDQALRDGARSMPPDLRKKMLPYFDEALLDNVRWTTSSARPGIDTLLAGVLEYDGAVTLDNVIVFFNDAAASDETLWIHELHHVRHYRSSGIEAFARAYVSGWRVIEQRVQAKSQVVLTKLARREDLKGRAATRA